MAQVLVRNLDDRVVESLKIKAEMKGHSLEQELEVLTSASALSPEERVAVADRIRATDAQAVHDRFCEGAA